MDSSGHEFDSTTDGPYRPPGSSDWQQQVETPRSRAGRRIGAATLCFSVLGVIGGVILPTLVFLLQALGRLDDATDASLRRAMDWMGPSLFIAFLLGAVGVWRYRSGLATVGLLVALIPLFLVSIVVLVLLVLIPGS